MYIGAPNHPAPSGLLVCYVTTRVTFCIESVKYPARWYFDSRKRNKNPAFDGFV